MGKEIEDGRRLIDALRKAGLSPTAALWCYIPETDEWRFAISLPMVDQVGSLKTYKKLRAVMLKMDPPVDFALSDISTQSPHDLAPFVKGTARFEAPHAEGFRPVRGRLDNRYVEEVYVYNV